MKARGTWQGMMTIAWLNWPFYGAATLVLLVAAWLFRRAKSPLVRLTSGLTFAGSVYFLFGSLGVSHLVYDRSDLYRWRWLRRALRGAARDRVVFCHAGFDEASAYLREHLDTTNWLVLDHFDLARMTEPSIHRARRLIPLEPETVAAPFDQWPVASGSVDVVFGMLAIHELRSESERTAWFAEAKRRLQVGGRVVLVEHTRDIANLLAFGPGVLHFHSAASWRRCWTGAGFQKLDEFRLTPWVRVFVLGVA